MFRIAAALTLCVVPLLHAVPACPGWVTVPGADGPLEIRMVGDEFCNWAETRSGHTLLSARDGHWVYAMPAADGSLQPTGPRWSAQGPAPEASRGLRPDPRWLETRSLRMQAQRNQRPDGRPAAREARVEGEWNVLVILIEYPDAANSYPTANFEAMMNEPGYGGVGSFRDYYQAMSYGRYGTTATVTDWYTAEQPHNYYGYNQGFERSQELVVEAVLAADPDIDFSQFDNDGDGTVDGLLVVHSGAGAEEGNQSNIWSHRWSLWGAGPLNLDGVDIWDYTIQPEIQGMGQAEIGVYVHEFGHNLGLPDLYDTDYSSTGVGQWCVMAGGSWGGTFGGPDRPVSFSAWCRNELGWATITTTNDELQDYGLCSAHLCDEVIRLNLPGHSSEHFLVENRQRAGWDQDLAGEGLLVWHIDQSRDGNSDDFHYKVDLEQADGTQDLNHGYEADGNDPFPGGTGNRAFNTSSTPSSRPYDGSESPVSIAGIGDPADTMVADFFQLFSHQDLEVLGAGVNWDEGGDLWLDPGEEATLTVSLRNMGGIINGLVVTVIGDSAPWLEVIDGQFSTGPLETGQTFTNGTDALRILPLADVTPGNHTLRLRSEDPSGWIQDVEIRIAVGRADVLIVNESPDPGHIAYLLPALEALGLTWEDRIKADANTAPADLHRYGQVLWFTGTTPSPLATQEQAALVTRLEQGDPLMLVGQFWQMGLGTALAQLAGASGGNLRPSTPVLVGNSGGGLFTPEERVLLVGANGAYNQEVPGRELVCTTAVPILDWQAGGTAAAVRELGSGARLVMLGFSLESVHASGTVFLGVPLILDRLVDWQLNGTDLPGIPLDRPQGFTLDLAPNPFNPTTRAGLTLSHAGIAELAVYNVQGRRVEHRELGLLAPGRHESTLDLGHLGSGVYFVSLALDGQPVALERALLVK